MRKRRTTRKQNLESSSSKGASITRLKNIMESELELDAINQEKIFGAKMTAKALKIPKIKASKMNLKGSLSTGSRHRRKYSKIKEGAAAARELKKANMQMERIEQSINPY